MEAKIGSVAPEEPTRPATFLKTQKLNLAERVGFVPKRRVPREPAKPEGHTLQPRSTEGEYWRRGWDSNPTGPFRFCKLQIPHCHGCRKCQRCRGALHAIARTAELRSLAKLRRDASVFPDVPRSCLLQLVGSARSSRRTSPGTYRTAPRINHSLTSRGACHLRWASSNLTCREPEPLSKSTPSSSLTSETSPLE